MMKWAKDSQRTKWAEEAQGTEWINPAGIMGSKDQKKEYDKKLTWQVLQPISLEATTKQKDK